MAHEFGVRLRTLRETAELTQTALARALGVESISYISSLERGARLPSLELVLRIAAYFAVPADYLLRGVNVPAPPESEVQFKRQIQDAPASYGVPTSAPEDLVLSLFGPKLRALRRNRAWTQATVAEQLGLRRQSYISMLESGVQAPSLDIVLRVAELFSVTVNDLVQDSVPVEAVRSGRNL